MKTAQSIIDNARLDLTIHIITLVRKLTAYIETDDEHLMAAEDVSYDFSVRGNAPWVEVEVDNSYLDVEENCTEKQCAHFITTETDNGNFFLTLVGGVELYGNELSTDELVKVAKILEKDYKKLTEK